MVLQLKESKEPLSPDGSSCSNSPHITALNLDSQSDNRNSRSHGTSLTSSSKNKLKIQQRKEACMQKHASKKSKGKVLSLPSPDCFISQTFKTILDLVIDGHASAWKECQESNKFWGGGVHGGQGIRITSNNFQNIHLPSISLCYERNELLVESTLDIITGHCYRLLGRNGARK